LGDEHVKTIKGRYNGSVVILEEPASADHEVAARVEFPESGESLEKEPHAPALWGGRFHWGMPRPADDTYEGSVADEIIRQRRMQR
jgi:hypothetical protein